MLSNLVADTSFFGLEVSDVVGSITRSTGRLRDLSRCG